jgi:DNA-binding beta-propeller fold protein YncE
MHRHRALLALLALSLLAVPACSTRERANPFDPANQQTSGRPVGFEARADDRRVTLVWVETQSAGLMGYRLFRREVAQGDFISVGDVFGTTVTFHEDAEVTNGVEYEYRLYYVFDDRLGDNPAVDRATPGKLRPWAVDAIGAFVRLTPDGRRVASRRTGLAGPTAIQVDSLNGEVWVSDTNGGNVLVHVPSSGVTVAIASVSSPVGLAVCPGSHSAYVCDSDQGAVYHFNSSGSQVSPALQPIANPIGVAYDRRDSSVWICERGAGLVRHYADDGTLLWSTALTAPSRVAVDEGTGYGWVTSFDGHRVWSVSPTGASQEMTRAVAGPIGIAVDARRGRIWVADALAGEVLGLARDGTVEVRVGGLSQVRSVAVHQESGEVWAAVLGSGEVVRLSHAGAVVQRLGGFGAIYDVALDPGRP